MPSFLEELQTMSDAHKRQVLVVSTIVIMAIVVGVWFTYFNSIVMGGVATGSSPAGAQSTQSQSRTTASAQAPAAANSGPGWWTRIRAGFSSLSHMFSNPSQYTIQPQQ